MECFSIDESGFTGFDLLNKHQPFQGSTAVSIQPEEAKRLIKYFFPRLQAAELKFRSIAKRSAYRKPLIELLRAVLSDHKCVTSVCDKRFVLILKFLDYAVEPFYYEHGVDYYADGQNFAYASLLYFTGPTLLGATEFEALLSAFQAAVRLKTNAAINRLLLIARSIQAPDLMDALGPLRAGSSACLDAICNPLVTTDAALAVLLSLIHRTEVLCTEPYRIEHDQSKNLRSYHDHLTRLIAHQDRVEFVVTRNTTMRFPLKLHSVSQVDSISSPSVQIADVMVGAALDAVRGTVTSGASLLDPDDVIAVFSEDQIVHLVPSPDFVAQRAFSEGSRTSELIDYIARHIDSGSA